MCPEIYKFCHLAYSHHSALQFGDFSISSQSGSHQDDPLGATILRRYLPISVILVLSLLDEFMDDITIVGARSTVASVVDRFRSEGVNRTPS